VVADIIEQLNPFLTDKHMVVSDVGDCLYAGLSLKTDLFMAPGYYSSMGFGVPAAIGAQVAKPDMRAVVLVGDGAFQMTGLEMNESDYHRFQQRNLRDVAIHRPDSRLLRTSEVGLHRSRESSWWRRYGCHDKRRIRYRIGHSEEEQEDVLDRCPDSRDRHITNAEAAD
jgi:hypothetical protein